MSDDSISQPPRPPLYIGCGCLVVDGEGRYLLVQETKRVARGRLALPAGKLEPHESIRAAAMRETTEETGLVVELDGLLGVFHCPMTSEGSFGVNFVFLAHPVAGTITTSDEHPAVEWFDAARVAELAAEGMVRGAHVTIAIERHLRDELLDADLLTEVPAMW